ncbi:MAG: CDP-archaeol synthase [candidate division WOR-3 bacterium]
MNTRSGELVLRVITAIVSLVIVLFCLFTSNSIFLYLLVAILGSIMLIEGSRLLDLERDYLVVTSIIFLIGCYLIYNKKYEVVSFMLFTTILIPTLKELLRTRQDLSILRYDSLFKTTFLCLWILTPLWTTLFLKNIGKEKLLFVVALSVWITDTFSYFGGRSFGKNYLHSASPKKTVEGAFCGLVATAVITTVIYNVMVEESITKGLVFSLLTGASAIVGDLVESAIKRRKGVKDSGKIFPGHGGALDRTDSLLFAIPFTLLFVK